MLQHSSTNVNSTPHFLDLRDERKHKRFRRRVKCNILDEYRSRFKFWPRPSGFNPRWNANCQRFRCFDGLRRSFEFARAVLRTSEWKLDTELAAHRARNLTIPVWTRLRKTCQFRGNVFKCECANSIQSKSCVFYSIKYLPEVAIAIFPSPHQA